MSRDRYAEIPHHPSDRDQPGGAQHHMAVSNRLRFEILRRDRFRCRYCGASAANAVLEIDHVEPRAKGGTDAPTNLVTACESCNSGKTDKPLDAPVIADVPEVEFRIACLEHAAPNPQESEEFEDFGVTCAVAWTRDWSPTFRDHGHFGTSFVLAVTAGFSKDEIVTACEAAGAHQKQDITPYLPARNEREGTEEAQAYDRAVCFLERFIPWERREFFWQARAMAGSYQPTSREIVRAAGCIAEKYVEDGRDYEQLTEWLRVLPGGEGSRHLVKATADWDDHWNGAPGHSAYECHDEVLEIAIEFALQAEVAA
jgi:hypothetical protein